MRFPGRAFGDMKLRLDQRRTEVGRALGDAHRPPPMKEGGPTHGDWDGKQHIGGNRFAGGSGGTGTAGLGGRAGPYRLDVPPSFPSSPTRRAGTGCQRTMRSG